VPSDSKGAGLQARPARWSLAMNEDEALFLASQIEQAGMHSSIPPAGNDSRLPEVCSQIDEALRLHEQLYLIQRFEERTAEL
jgi:hypothetical protein